jgi:hypothetical protein
MNKGNFSALASIMAPQQPKFVRLVETQIDTLERMDVTIHKAEIKSALLALDAAISSNGVTLPAQLAARRQALAVASA